MYTYVFVYCFLYECDLLLATVSQQLFLGSGGKWQSFPQQDKEMITSHGWDTKAMWRLFVYMHMMVWVVKYEVNYLKSFRQFPKGSVSGYCIILHCCTWSQSYEDCLRIWFYRILHHNVEKKEIIIRPQKKIVFPSYLPFFRIKHKRKKFCLPTYPSFFQSVSGNTGISFRPNTQHKFLYVKGWLNRPIFVFSKSNL